MLDPVAVEEPLEVRVVTPEGDRPLLVTMRTPGHDLELVRGWLHAEGAADLHDLRLLSDPEAPNVLRVIAPSPEQLLRLARAGVTASACGVCGTGSVERLSLRVARSAGAGPALSASWVRTLPEQLLAVQPGFSVTGGLHVAALFQPNGGLLASFEDVGRHNAVDKLIGWAWANGLLPIGPLVLVVSSRAGFEIVQKAAIAGAQRVVSVGAPTSLAVETAGALGMTLVGFVRADRLNVYSGADQVQP